MATEFKDRKCPNPRFFSACLCEDLGFFSRVKRPKIELTAEEHGGFRRGPQRKSNLGHYAHAALQDPTQRQE